MTESEYIEHEIKRIRRDWFSEHEATLEERGDISIHTRERGEK